MAKPKPIIAITIPHYMAQEGVDKISKSVKETVKEEYHVFIITNNSDEINFQVFYEKDFNEVKYKELKTIIKELCKR